MVNREGGYLRPRSGERSYDVFAVNCSMNILNGVTYPGCFYSSVTQPSAADFTFLMYLNNVPRVAL